MAPIWLNKAKTTDKIMDYIHQAGREDCDLVVFGEALLPGYPYWLSITDGSAWDQQDQKEIFAHYSANTIQIEAGDLDPICRLAVEYELAIYLGTIERPMDRAGHSLYCTLVYIDQAGQIQSIHRKLQPTYEERLVWSMGDGHGLRVHELGRFTIGGLNCWENWMPLVRSSLYAQGEDLHVAVWPGALRNTQDLTRHIAKESRSYSISVSGLMRRSDIPTDTPHFDKIVAQAPELLSDGGSCIAAPDGSWVIPPQVGEEGLYTATIDHLQVRMERQNFDPSGHYSRPSVTQLHVNRERQSIVKFSE